MNGTEEERSLHSSNKRERKGRSEESLPMSSLAQIMVNPKREGKGNVYYTNGERRQQGIVALAMLPGGRQGVPQLRANRRH